MPFSSRTSLITSGTVFFVKMRLCFDRVSPQSRGTSTARRSARPPNSCTRSTPASTPVNT
ncbi:hypothetical protein BE20_32045 [Sorangium cellulosum]|nr:hypothetical protein BE20_32045 [Sorangium cellulosum]